MPTDPQTTFQGREDSEIAVVLNRFERGDKDRKLTWPDHRASTNLNLQFLLEKAAGVRIPILPPTQPLGNPEGYGAKGIIFILNGHPRTGRVFVKKAAMRIKDQLKGRKMVVVAGKKAWNVVQN